MSHNTNKSFISLIKEIDLVERSQRDRGTLFELLVKVYFENEPLYHRLFDKIWMLNEVPANYNIPKVDTGVDLVARKSNTGELVAIQCKYYSKDTVIRKEHIDSFLNEVGKSYYSEGLVVTTTDKWSNNAEQALSDRDKSVMRISLAQLKDSRIDWSNFSFSKPEKIILHNKKSPRSHQVPAIRSVIEAFDTADRGKLIMAPGTGKTYTSMAIAEELAKKSDDTFKVLYLVPSIQLLSQTLRSWNADINFNMDSIAVCSDRKVTKEKIGAEIEDIATSDIGFPATTNHTKLIEYQKTINDKGLKPEIITVFSTYQSIDVIINAQKQGFYEFDLIVCDEAHRTTGTTELNQESSAFTKVHDNNNLKAKKRLYQTATPRIYGEDAKRKAEEKSVIIADMNDSDTYGEELYRIGFGDAISKGILTDYKVMVLAVDEDVITRRFQDMFAKTESGLQFDDVTKIIGCWNGLVKRDGKTNKTLGQPMKRAIAFTGTIKDSKKITQMFSTVVDEYLYSNNDYTNNHFKIEIEHADGSMNAIEKNERIDWLKSDVPDNTCRVLSNARFLTEGVDIPDLDAVMFLKPRKSKIDIAQAVGRVMRKAEGKDYGYIILPIGVPSGSEAHSILDNNEKYAVVWEILNALRSIDERFDAVINKIELNKKKPSQINVIGVGDSPEDGELENPPTKEEQLSLDLSDENLNDLERAIYGKIVQKVGNVRYWEQWSENVAEIAQQHISRINIMLEDKESTVYLEFRKFLQSLRYNINDSIDEQQAIEMLSQHLITKPVFEALFESYSFVGNNPVSQAMETILEVLDKQGLLKEQEQLEKFYESVRIRAEGIDNLKAKQDIIVQLYDKFFKVGFKETTERLGIVFTPVEVVDFIIQSVDDILIKHFGKSLSSKGVHILDPFTGTGTFITRLLQSGLIDKDDLLRKYTQEIHANEIVLLSYYIAAINIEETFHSLYRDSYVPFEGIVLTDTFASTENKDSFISELFGENNKRLQRQQDESIFAIIGNPPYSVGSDSTSSEQNKYHNLEEAIRNTYAKHTDVKNKNSLYDSYIKAIRWSSDRINQQNGVVAFVSNGQYIDSRSASGLRKSLHEEFNHVYVYNIRGDARTSGERRRKESGNVFGEGTRTPIAILILVKDGTDDHTIHYHDIGDYLSREEKLKIIADKKSITNIEWEELIPDTHNDWVNLRDDSFNDFIPIYDNKDSIFLDKSTGVTTGRDAWVVGFSKTEVLQNVDIMVKNYNNELENYKESNDIKTIKATVNKNGSYIKWDDNLYGKFSRGEKIDLNQSNVIKYMYRPFTKKWIYYDNQIIQRPRSFKNVWGNDNLIIYCTGIGSKEFSCLVTDQIPDKGLMAAGQGFFLYNNNEDNLLFNNENISEKYCSKFNMTSEELFHYVYAILHSKDYVEKYAFDLTKTYPRIPLVKNKNQYIEIGKKLLNLHLNYEDIELYQNINIVTNNDPSYRVEKMRHPKRNQLDEIIFNNDIRITNIPVIAYDYKLNGKSAIGWIMDQYRVKLDTKSRIKDDPNDFSENKKYVFDLLLQIINLSIQTLELVESLPTLELDE